MERRIFKECVNRVGGCNGICRIALLKENHMIWQPRNNIKTRFTLYKQLVYYRNKLPSQPDHLWRHMMTMTISYWYFDKRHPVQMTCRRQPRSKILNPHYLELHWDQWKCLWCVYSYSFYVLGGNYTVQWLLSYSLYSLSNVLTDIASP